MQAHNIVKYRLANVGADSFPQPRHQIEAYESADGYSGSDADQQGNSAFEVGAGAAAEPAVDQHLQTPAQRQCGPGGEQQGKAGTCQSQFVLSQ